MQITGDENQSRMRPRSSVICRQPMAIASNTRPATSTGSFALGVSRPLNSISDDATTNTPTGAFTRKIHGQL